jgi:hypothetical protein
MAASTGNLKIAVFKVVQIGLLVNAPVDYLSYFETRHVIRAMSRATHTWRWITWLIVDLVVTLLFAVVAGSAVNVAYALRHNLDTANLLLHPSAAGASILVHAIWQGIAGVWMDFSGGWITRYLCLYPAFFTSIWLWLYAGSGFLLKAARRFDIGFQWFNRRFDIEKHPLSAIGLVAGSLVACVYWAAVIFVRLVHY